jgi:hypothetical protein
MTHSALAASRQIVGRGPLERFSSKSLQMTERAGFEPAMEFNPHTRLAGECLQPLGHLSLGSAWIGLPV